MTIRLKTGRDSVVDVTVISSCSSQASGRPSALSGDHCLRHSMRSLPHPPKPKRRFQVNVLSMKEMITLQFPRMLIYMYDANVWNQPTTHNPYSHYYVICRLNFPHFPPPSGPVPRTYLFSRHKMSLQRNAPFPISLGKRRNIHFPIPNFSFSVETLVYSFFFKIFHLARLLGSEYRSPWKHWFQVWGRTRTGALSYRKGGSTLRSLQSCEESWNNL